MICTPEIQKRSVQSRLANACHESAWLSFERGRSLPLVAVLPSCRVTWGANRFPCFAFSLTLCVLLCWQRSAELQPGIQISLLSANNRMVSIDASCCIGSEWRDVLMQFCLTSLQLRLTELKILPVLHKFDWNLLWHYCDWKSKDHENAHTEKFIFLMNLRF